MVRYLIVLTGMLTIFSCEECQARWYARWYGWGNYYGNYDSGGSTPYSNAVRAQAELTLAQGAARESAAKAAISAEQARRVYLENQARYLEMRREQKAVSDAKKQQRLEESSARNSLKPPPKSKTELYPRLSSDQLDPLTGEIQWPEWLTGSEYAEDREIIESALKSQAEFGPDARTSRIIYDAAHRMMAIRSRNVTEIGSQAYTSCRRFLNSLAIEGEHALEVLK